MLSSASDSADDAAEAPPVPTLSPQAAALLAALPNASTPYLTCARCNCVAFINVLRVRWRSEEKDEQRLSEFEQLPICTGCGSTKYLRAGVVSFQEKIEEERVAIKEFERKRVPATALIQRVARGFLGRLECRRRKVEHERYLRKINRSATRLQARVRGMQARRRAVLERCLRLIRAMHPSVLAFALAARPDRPPVFWYENPAERSVFFWNYREFVRRAGGRPTLIKVETNVLEITRRMLLREYVLVSRIQSRWRGITARLVFREFKRQRAWLRGIQQSPAIKVQRLFRGHTSRKQCRALRVTTQYPSQLAAYRQSRAEQAERERRKAFRAKLLGKYRLAFQVDKTTRMLTRHTQPSVGAHVLSKASSEGDIGPETRAHVHHSLRTSTSTATIPTTSQSKRRAEAANGGSERSRKIVPTDEMRGGDASGRTTSEREENEEEEEGEEQKRDWSNRSVNSRRFAQLKRTLEAKSRSRLRDPRAHIVRAQQLLATAAARK
ncbi:hypothetical protein PybrP1_001153 [[Pythium] brassicae (nom. inval.)]|nr:hypothetical protein PybrP1_001153 [[Pythium] brassicae (nom. inval.)]